VESVGTEAAQRALREALGASYELDREVGGGGMATIYLARDLRHRRAVAVKMLHPELSAMLGPERFLREIELTANLQHAHIVPLFDSGSAGGLLYYVMPYIEGESLRARLERERQLPVEDAVRLAREVAEALAYAHARGVVHRDIKPENILLQNGHALVADFGIALAVEQASGKRITQTGLSLGTPQYMAPEQAAGEKEVDARADVYALGAVLYEMLAGEPPFMGPTAQAVVAKVMTEEVAPLTRHRRSVPPHVESAILIALEKLPADRFPTADAFAAALAGTSPFNVPLKSRSRPARLPSAGVAALAVGALVVTAALGWQIGRMSAARHMSAEVQRPVRFTIAFDSAVRRENPMLALSPDGHTLIFAAGMADGGRLYARRLDDLAARPLAGTEDAERPFFSPDGAWVAFFSHGALRKVRVDGGAPVVVVGVPPSTIDHAGSWSPGDTLLYTNSGTLYRVSAAGGPPSRVAVADTGLHLLTPHLLPGGRAVLVTVTPDFSVGYIGVLDLASGRVRQLGPGLAPQFAAGHLVYGSIGGELYRQPFDLERLEPTGAAEQIASSVGVGFGGEFAAATVDALAYQTTSWRMGGLSLTITDRAGREQRVLAMPGIWAPRFSPDGRRVAHGGSAPGRDSSDLWVTDLGSGTTQRLTTDGMDNNDPVWSPDGRFIAYSAEAPGGKDVFVRPLEGGQARLLIKLPGIQWPTDWVHDGSGLLFTNTEVTGGRAGAQDIWVQPFDGTAARPYVATPARDGSARASPNGRWVAYQSDESGRFEVYVQAYPAPGLKTLVSAGGGGGPVWRGDGRELYYWQGDQLFAVSIAESRPGDAPAVRRPTPLLRAPYVGGFLANYDVSPDGMRFAIVTARDTTTRLVVVLHALNAGGAGNVVR
jgi:eukaryotic-like serine/threonine-protein kinase